MLALRSDAAGRIRWTAPLITGSPARAVAVEDAVDRVPHVRAVHAHPLTGSVVIWCDPHRIDRAELIAAVERALLLELPAAPARTPRSADDGTGDLVRLAVGGIALAALGVRR